MSEFFPEPKSSEERVKVELNLCIYATKADLKNTADVDTSDFALKTDLANLKSDVDKLDIDKLKNVPTTLSNLKSKWDKLDVDKLVTFSVYLSELNDVVKNDIVKEDVCDAKMQNIEDKIPNITNIANNTALNVNINEVKKKIATITNLATTNYSYCCWKKKPNVSNLVKKTDHNTKNSEIENKITPYHDHDKYITTQEFNKLTLENTTGRLAQANLASKNDIANFIKKTDFDDKLKKLNENVTSNKTKHVLVENELNELSEKVKTISTKGFEKIW